MRWIKRIRLDKEGVKVAADVHAAVSVNTDEPGATQTVRSVSHTSVAQDSRDTPPSSSGETEESEKKEEHR